MTAKGKTATGKTAAQDFLQLVKSQLKLIKNDLPHLVDVGQSMAEQLLKGGQIFVPRNLTYWISEFSGRSGGLMVLNGKADSAKDIAYTTLPSEGKWSAEQEETFKKLVKGKAKIYIIGSESDLPSYCPKTRIAAFTGSIKPGAGMYSHDGVKPLAAMRPFDQFVRGWVTAGEMMTACIREEKMPRIWSSVWHEAAIARNAAMLWRPEQSNMGEPHEYDEPVPFFHRDRFITPLPPTYAAEELFKAVDLFVATLEAQTDTLTQIGQWLAQAKQENKRIIATATGHSHPEVLELPKDDSYPVEWGPPYSNSRRAAPESLKPGDIALHLGYAPIHIKNIESILKQGVKYIHTSPYGPRKNMPQHKNFLYFDLPWRPADAWVDIPGYSVRILPSSSTAHSIAYPAIMCEFAKAMGWSK